jgi:hypothetical protein
MTIQNTQHLLKFDRKKKHYNGRLAKKNNRKRQINSKTINT